MRCCTVLLIISAYRNRYRWPARGQVRECNRHKCASTSNPCLWHSATTHYDSAIPQSFPTLPNLPAHVPFQHLLFSPPRPFYRHCKTTWPMLIDISGTLSHSTSNRLRPVVWREDHSRPQDSRLQSMHTVTQLPGRPPCRLALLTPEPSAKHSPVDKGRTENPHRHLRPTGPPSCCPFAPEHLDDPLHC